MTDDSPRVEHGGKTYYFCCAHCLAVFNRDPGKYVDGPDAAGRTAVRSVSLGP